jgi:DNA polymerase epsilon subunit 1
MLQHYFRISVWLKERIDLAGRFNIPLCNLERDTPLFVADIDFARRLSKADLLLWWSPGSRPDLGGGEADANFHQLSEELTNPEISRPGCYSTASIEIELRDLAVDSVLQSALVYELEGVEGGSLGFTEASHNLDEYAKGTANGPVALGDAILPVQTFAILKSMVKSWVNEGAKADCHHHRVLVDHFWRWASSPSARLFDPAIHRFVHGLMRKTFSQILAEFRRLGSEVIYADFGRLILLTSKPSACAAYAYANYIASSVNSRELFKFVTFEITRFFEHVVWMDVANHSTIVNEDPAEEPDESALAIDVEFNIASSLPPALQEHFSTVIGAFVHLLRQAKLQSTDNRTPLRVVQNAQETMPDPSKKKELDLARNFIKQKHTRQVRFFVYLLEDYHILTSEIHSSCVSWKT